MACFALLCLLLWGTLERAALGAPTNAESWASSVESALREQLGARPQGSLLVVLSHTHKKTGPPFVSQPFPFEIHSFLRDLQEFKLRTMVLLNASPERVQEKHNHHGLRVDAVLLVLDEDAQAELQSALQVLEVSASWSPRLPHLVATPTPGGAENVEDATALLTALWERKVTRAILLQSVSSEFEIWKWNPRGLGEDCNGPTSSSVIKIRQAPSNSAYPLVPSIHDNSFNFFSGCSLRASAWDFPPYAIKRPENGSETDPLFQDGLDVRIVQEVARRLEMSVDFENRELEYFPAGELVANGSANVTVGAFVMMSQFYPAMDPTMSYWSELAMWIVPEGAPIPRWLSIVVVFSLEMWIFLLISYVLMVGVFAVVEKVERLKTLNALDVFRFFLGNSIVTLPGGSLGCALLLVWIVSDVVISSAYQSALVSFLTDPGMYKPVSSEEELIQSGLKIGLVPNYRYVFESYDDENAKIFLERSFDCIDIRSCVDRVAHFRDSAMPCEMPCVDYYYDGDGRQNIKIMGSIEVYSIMMFVTKGSPLLEPWNFYLFGLAEGSLLSHWWKEITSRFGPLRGNSVSIDVVESPVEISLTHLQSVFFLWIIGIMCSSVVFCAEVGRMWIYLNKPIIFDMILRSLRKLGSNEIELKT